MSFALLTVAAALVVVAVLLVRRTQADVAHDAAARRERSGLARAWAEISSAKTAAEARSAQLEATLAGMSDGVMMLDADNRLVQWNDRFPELSGVPRAVLAVGVGMDEMVRAQVLAGEFPEALSDPDAEVARRMARVRATRDRVVSERTRPDGRVIELRRNPLPNGGMVTLYTDITARRRAEAAQREIDAAAARLVEQKAQLVTMVCHEAAAPLEVAIENLRELEREAQAGGQPRLPAPLRLARNAVDTLSDLMHDILDLAQLDTGRLALRPVDYQLSTLLADLADAYGRRAAERSMLIAVEIAPSLPARLHGEARRVRQVLANYLSNAVKYADPGEIRLRASRLDLGRPMLRLAVADRGPRVPPAQAALLFGPSTRLAEAGSIPGAAARSGLGLVICARLARAMGGEVGLAAGAGGGNEFWLTVPLREAAPDTEPDTEAQEAGTGARDIDAQAAADGEPPAAPPAAGGALTGRLPARQRRRRASVLLVEDLQVNQLVVATRLRREGHHVALASTGEEALAQVRRAPYDLVLTDLMMPGMSGYDVARAIRALPGPAGRVPIFALTATTSPEDRARCFAAGMQGMLAKPLNADELATALAAAPLPPASPAMAPSVPPSTAPTQPSTIRPPSERLIDTARLATVREGLPAGVFSDIAAECLTDLGEQVVALRAALGGEVPRPVEETAHAIAGAAANYGLQAVEARMRRVMAAARAGDLPAARAAARGAEAELTRTGEVLELLLEVHDA